ncbi:uracilDNA glycosylase [Pelomyxa schiedti]|nr:uracilDNA glycosylase [Pelomyxa schiedti]
MGDKFTRAELEKMTLLELRDRLRERKLKVGGLKAELVTRLLENDARKILDDAPSPSSADSAKDTPRSCTDSSASSNCTRTSASTCTTSSSGNVGTSDNEEREGSSNDDQPVAPRSKRPRNTKGGPVEANTVLVIKKSAGPPVVVATTTADNDSSEKSDDSEPEEGAEGCSGTPAVATSAAASPVFGNKLNSVPALEVKLAGTDFDHFPKSSTWRDVLDGSFRKEYFYELMKFVQKERQSKVIFPPAKDVWNAFEFTPFDQVRVVIIGQDPYINAGQAHGLCFSVKRGVAVPPSLKRMYEELKRSIPTFRAPNHGCLESWARQGVFMINATLTVEKGQANSHKDSEWSTFTDEVVQVLNERKKNVIYLLWGAFAKKKGARINKQANHILVANHPSPQCGTKFMNCNHFVKTNEILESLGEKPIDWHLPP